MDLADRIVSSNNSAQYNNEDFFKYKLPEYDEFGLKTGNSPDYIVARIMYIQSKKPRGCLHFRHDDSNIWEGDHWVSETAGNLYRLAKWSKPITSPQAVVIWDKLKEVLPELSEDKVVVNDKLVWNKVTKELEEEPERPFVI